MKPAKIVLFLTGVFFLLALAMLITPSEGVDLEIFRFHMPTFQRMFTEEEESDVDLREIIDNQINVDTLMDIRQDSRRMRYRITPASSSRTHSILWPVRSHSVCKSRRPLGSSARKSTSVPRGKCFVRFLKRRMGSGHTRPTASTWCTSCPCSGSGRSVKPHTLTAVLLG